MSQKEMMPSLPQGTKEENLKSIAIKVLATVVAFFLPPAGVLIARGSFNQLTLNIILTVMFWVPGIIHALYVIFSDDR